MLPGGESGDGAGSGDSGGDAARGGRLVQWDDASARSRFLAAGTPLAGLPQAVLDVLAGHLTLRGFESGDVLIRQGDVGDCVLIVADGDISVTLTGADGDETTLAERGPVRSSARWR